MIIPRLGLASFTKIARVLRKIRDRAAPRFCPVPVLLGLYWLASNPHAHDMANADTHHNGVLSGNNTGTLKTPIRVYECVSELAKLGSGQLGFVDT